MVARVEDHQLLRRLLLLIQVTGRIFEQNNQINPLMYYNGDGKGGCSMQEDLNKEILIELKKINQKLDELNEEPQVLSKSMKVIALFIGFTVIGPIVAILISKLFE
jgi:hypothetical protein